MNEPPVERDRTGTHAVHSAPRGSNCQLVASSAGQIRIASRAGRRTRDVERRVGLIPRCLAVRHLDPPRDLPIACRQLSNDPSVAIKSEQPEPRRLACHRAIPILEPAASARQDPGHLGTEEEALAAVPDPRDPNRRMNGDSCDPPLVPRSSRPEHAPGPKQHPRRSARAQEVRPGREMCAVSHACSLRRGHDRTQVPRHLVNPCHADDCLHLTTTRNAVERVRGARGLNARWRHEDRNAANPRPQADPPAHTYETRTSRDEHRRTRRRFRRPVSPFCGHFASWSHPVDHGRVRMAERPVASHIDACRHPPRIA